jgi:hypothetical protein
MISYLLIYSFTSKQAMAWQKCYNASSRDCNKALQQNLFTFPRGSVVAAPSIRRSLALIAPEFGAAFKVRSLRRAAQRTQ